MNSINKHNLISAKDLYFVKASIFFDNLVWIQYICDAYNAMIISDLYDYVKETIRIDYNVSQIIKNKIKQNEEQIKHIYSEAHMHSFDLFSLYNQPVGEIGICYARDIIKNGFYNWKCSYIKEQRKYNNICEDIIIKVKLIQRLFKEAMYNPNYALCRKRLYTEFTQMSYELCQK